MNLRDAYYLKSFQLEFRTRTGTEFQTFFVGIMKRRYPSDFQDVKPYGKQGDLKCDGYLQSKCRVFQCYGPEKMDSAVTVKKITEDFGGAVEHWAHLLKEWVFVHNQWRGVPPDVLKNLLSLDGTHGKKVHRWCEIEVQDELLSMDETKIAEVLGPAPSDATYHQVAFSDLQILLQRVAQTPAESSGSIQDVPGGKIEANSLSDEVKQLLLAGSRKSGLVKAFFERWPDPEVGDRIARAFRLEYLKVRDNGWKGDDIFFHLWRFAGGRQQVSVQLEAAVLALLAFLFEECEIFESSNGSAIAAAN